MWDATVTEDISFRVHGKSHGMAHLPVTQLLKISAPSPFLHPTRGFAQPPISTCVWAHPRVTAESTQGLKSHN